MLLLCSTLGDENCRPLSAAQFRTLADRVRALGPGEADLRRDLTARDLTRLGYAPEEAERIEHLLSREAALHAYLSTAERRGIFPLTRITPGYPSALRVLLGDRCRASASSARASPMNVPVALPGASARWPRRRALCSALAVPAASIPRQRMPVSAAGAA